MGPGLWEETACFPNEGNSLPATAPAAAPTARPAATATTGRPRGLRSAVARRRPRRTIARSLSRRAVTGSLPRSVVAGCLARCRVARSWAVRPPPAWARTRIGPVLLILLRRSVRLTRRRLLVRTGFAKAPESTSPPVSGLTIAARLRRTCVSRSSGRGTCAANSAVGASGLTKPAEPGLRLRLAGRPDRVLRANSLPSGRSSRSPGLGIGLLPREEPQVLISPWGIRHRAVRESPVHVGSGDRHLPADQSRLGHLGSRRPPNAVEPAAPEVIRPNRRNPICHASISIVVCDVYVGNINATVEAIPAVESASPPGVERLVRSQWDPAHVAEPKAHACAVAEAEEGHQSRRPILPHTESARIPAPSIATLIEPAAVVVGRPTPGIVADPGPSIPVFPSPAAIPVRRPIGRHRRGTPHVSIRRYIGPGARGIQVFRAIDALRNILRAGGLQQHAVARVIPAVPIVVGDGGHHLEFGVG